MALAALEYAGLDEVWLMPSGHSPHKDERHMTPFKDRYRMCQLAVDGYDRIKVSSYEMEKDVKNYTYLTMTSLAEDYPDEEFYFIMGADSLDYFDHWVHPEIICRCCKLLVINRGEFTLSDLNHKIASLENAMDAHITVVPCEKYDISSTELRQEIHEGISCIEHLNEAEYQYIMEHKLY